MLAGNSFEGPDLSASRWPFYIFAAVSFAALLGPVWPWLQRRRVASWPTAEGHIESAEVTEGKSTWYSTGSGSPVIAELGYSYSIAGSLEAGWHRRDFPTEHEAQEFIRDLKGKPVAVHYNPNKPSSSRMSEPALDMLLRNRAPILPYESESAFPRWIQPFLWVFICISAVGLVVSLWVHLGAVLGYRVGSQSLFFILHVGIFAVWLPAMFAGSRLAGSVDLKYYWKVVLKHSPGWMRYMVIGFFGYAFVNFLLFIMNAPHGSSGPDVPVVVWRGFSGHWMAFYSFAFAALYSAAHARRSGRLCLNGHFVPMGGRWCEHCGQPVTRG